MEILGEVLVQACCEFLAAGGADMLLAFVGWKSHQVKVDARRHGIEPTITFWGTLFKVILPLAIVLTLIFIVSLAARLGNRN